MQLHKYDRKIVIRDQERTVFMKIKQLSTVFLCAALCTALMTGCGERKEVSLSDNSDENIVSSVLTEESSPDVSSAVSDASAENSDTSNISDKSSPQSTVSSGSGANSSTASTPAQSSSASQSGPQTAADNSVGEHQHQYTVTKTTEPTCSEIGYEVYTCSCGDQYTKTTSEALGHTYSTSKVDPTCTASGYTTYTCTRCGQSHKDDVTAALGHKYTSKTVKATCAKGGYTLNTCSRCGHEYKSDNTSALGHSWGEWTVTKNATTSSEGVKTSKCTRCGETKTESIPKLKADNDYVSEVIRLVNVERAKHGLSPLTMRADLNEYAQLRCTEIVDNFDHVRPDGSKATNDVLRMSGVMTAGENIAWGQKTPEAVMEAWMNSTGHRENILRSTFTSIGVGCYEYGGRYYWTQIIAG